MVEITVFGFDLKQKDREFIKKMFTNVVGQEPKYIQDLASKIASAVGDVSVVCGIKAKKALAPTMHLFNPLYELPDIYRLEPEPGNDETREQAYKTLCELKVVLEKPQTKDCQPITEGSLPDLSVNSILDTLKKLGTKEWKGKTKDGRKIRLTVDPDVDTSVDISLTFAEFILLKSAMETLQMKELHIVNNDPKGSK